MNVDAIITGILERKEHVGMTNQQIADASGVPRTTVNRILAKQTQNPSIKTVADIAMAVGYDIDPVQPSVLQDYTKDSYITYLQEAVEAEKKISEKRITEQRAHYTMLLAEKNRWIKYLFITVIILVCFLIGWLVVDVLHPTAGWIQRELAWYTDYKPGSIFDNLLQGVRGWLGAL